LAMSDIVETCMQKISFEASPVLDDYLNTDKETRIFAQNLIKTNALKGITI
jgi:1-deoxy-D-xylulose-5-phosphate reductoisomerase